MTELPARPPTATPPPTAVPDYTDEQLMVMIQAHDHRGLDLLHDRYAKLLKMMSMKVLHNGADAEDLLQEVLLEIWKRAANFNPLKGRPLSWIATLTRRRSIDRLYKRQSYCRVEEKFAEETQRGGDGWTHVHEDLSQAERKKHLQRALAVLPESQRNAIHLTYYRQMSQREIATNTGIPLGTIKTRLQLGLRKMAVSLCGLDDLPGTARAAQKKGK